RILIQSGRKEEGTKFVERSKAMETKLVVDSRQQTLESAPGSEIALSSTQPNAMKADSANLTDEQKSQIAAAEKALSTILGDSLNDLGTSEARQGEYATALTHFQEAERWNPEIAGLQRNIGLAAFLSGNYEESAKALRVLVQSDNSDHRSQAMLAMSLYMLKQYP